MAIRRKRECGFILMALGVVILLVVLTFLVWFLAVPTTIRNEIHLSGPSGSRITINGKLVGTLPLIIPFDQFSSFLAPATWPSSSPSGFELSSTRTDDMQRDIMVTGTSYANGTFDNTVFVRNYNGSSLSMSGFLKIQAESPTGDALAVFGSSGRSTTSNFGKLVEHIETLQFRSR